MIFNDDYYDHLYSHKKMCSNETDRDRLIEVYNRTINYALAVTLFRPWSYTFRVLPADGHIVHDDGDRVHQKNSADHDKRCNQQIVVLLVKVVHRWRLWFNTRIDNVKFVKGLKGVYRYLWKTNRRPTDGPSSTIWELTVLSASQHRWACPALTPAKQAGTRLTYTGSTEGWVDLGVGYTPRWFTCPWTS